MSEQELEVSVSQRSRSRSPSSSRVTQAPDGFVQPPNARPARADLLGDVEPANPLAGELRFDLYPEDRPPVEVPGIFATLRQVGFFNRCSPLTKGIACLSAGMGSGFGTILSATMIQNKNTSIGVTVATGLLSIIFILTGGYYWRKHDEEELPDLDLEY